MNIATSPSTTVTRLVPISELSVADENPRSSDTVNDEFITLLAENISELGLLTPLVGYEGSTAVQITAGGRRLRALRKLCQDGSKVPSDAVPVNVMDFHDAVQAGVGEQLTHQPLTRLDELRIFHLRPDLTDSECSRLFGRSLTAVKQRRAVLKLPETVLDMVLQEILTVDQGYGLTYWLETETSEVEAMAEETVKRDLSSGEIRRQFLNRVSTWAKSPWKDLVTLEEYEDSGGRIQQDLFGEDKFILDPEKLRLLAHFPLIEKAKADHPGYGFYHLFEGDTWEARDHHSTWIIPDTDPTDEQAAEIADLEAQMDQICEDAGVGYVYELGADGRKAYDALSDKLTAIEDSLSYAALTDEIKSKLGVLVCQTRHGYRFITEILPDDVAPLIDLGAIEEHVETLGPGSDSASSDAAPEDKGDAFSASLIQRIRQIKLHIFRQEAIKKPDTVLSDYLICVSDMFNHTYSTMPEPNWNAGAGFDGVVESKDWVKSIEIASLPPETLRNKRPLDHRKGLAARILMCANQSAVPDLDPETVRAYFTPGKEWFNYYTKKQLLPMVCALKPPVGHDYTHKTKGEVVAICSEAVGSHPDWLPSGF